MDFYKIRRNDIYEQYCGDKITTYGKAGPSVTTTDFKSGIL